MQIVARKVGVKTFSVPPRVNFVFQRLFFNFKWPSLFRHEIQSSSVWNDLDLLHEVVAGVKYQKPHHVRRPVRHRQVDSARAEEGRHPERRDWPQLADTVLRWTGSVAPVWTNELRPRRRPWSGRMAGSL